jgi:hypothetical protein
MGPFSDTAERRPALFLSDEEQAISERASMRYVAFLTQELEQIPDWHHLHAEYLEQRDWLEHRAQRGPRRAPPSTAA